MLNISPEKVCYIVVKAREFDVKVEPDGPASGSNPADDNEIDVLEDLADDATYEELLSALRLLNEDESLDLVALAWVGRGTYSMSEWGEARRQAREIGRAILAAHRCSAIIWNRASASWAIPATNMK